jgi:hypothetical protein
MILACAALALSPTPSSADAVADSAARDRLAPTAQSAWVPAAPVPASETWETVLRLPGAVISLPLRGLGHLTESGLVYAEEENVIPRLMALLAFQEDLGLVVLPASLGDRTGLGGTVAWAPPGLGQYLTGELSGSTSHYNRERVAAFAGPLRAVYTSEWRPQDQFIGIGMGFDEGDESVYAARSQSLRVIAVYPDRPRRRASLALVDGAFVHPSMAADAPARTQLTLWGGPRETFVTNGRDPEEPSIEVRFPDVGAATLHRRVEHLVYGARLSRDARRGSPHWTHGWRASLEAERYDRSIEALALKDAHSDARSFTRVTYRAEGGVSVGTDPRTLRLAVRVVDQTLDSGGGTFLVSDYRTLGGSEGLAGFEPGRFHDIDLVVGRLSYIFPLGKNLEFDLHVESGGVFPALGAVRADRLRHSYGGLLRVRADAGMLGAVGFEWSREAARLKFSIGGVE